MRGLFGIAHVELDIVGAIEGQKVFGLFKNLGRGLGQTLADGTEIKDSTADAKFVGRILFQPTLPIGRVLEVQGRLGQPKRFEGIHHYSQLSRFLLADRALVGTGVWAVGNARGV